MLFKRPQSRKAYYDPRGMEMDLGNDAIRAATIAFENLGKVVANANQWLDKEDFNYEKRASLYGEIINQADEYVKHVLQQVGGIYLNDSYQGDSYPSYQPVSKELQRRSYPVDDGSYQSNELVGQSGTVESLCADR
ncbi:zinc-dependent metalloprotease [Bacteroides xylanisolvens]|nr:zinc-dependent metalloprotease [Bacteroides xylanisolvens]